MSPLQQSACEFAGKLPPAPAPGADAGEKHRLLREAWKHCADFGLFSMAVPRELGGDGFTNVEILEVLEGLGEGCSNDGLLFAVGAHLWAVIQPIARFGTPEQRERYLPLLMSGDWIGAHAMTESENNSGAASTRYAETDDGYVIDGLKLFITNAPAAELFLVFATRDPLLGSGGASAFLVEAADAGITTGPDERKLGLDGSMLSSVALRDVVVPHDRMLGPRDGGRDVFTCAMQWERLFILAPLVGAMKRQTQRAVEYARERRVSGRPIGKLQMVSARIADMYVRYITVRAFLRENALLRDSEELNAARVSAAKLMLAESGLLQHLDALRIHGGYGYMAEAGIESELRGAIGGLIYSGTAEVQRVMIAHELGL
ncbi:MAG TPA: acyl-CoA dehydrogenase family protein [Thermoanaerobaculia bacterium]|nr:acyl-CoA dehydrogenase family protein [Thermoanaerobaculia bacterium]